MVNKGVQKNQLGMELEKNIWRISDRREQRGGMYID